MRYIYDTGTGGQELICLPGDTEINTLLQHGGERGRAIQTTHSPKTRERERPPHTPVCCGAR